MAIGQQNTAQGGGGGGALGELTQSDLSSLVPSAAEGQMNDEDILKHFSDTAAIEIDSLLNEFSNTPYIKVSIGYNRIKNCFIPEHLYTLPYIDLFIQQMYLFYDSYLTFSFVLSRLTYIKSFGILLG